MEKDRSRDNEHADLYVTRDGDVYINQSRVCIQPVERQSLPRGDIVASLLMTLATSLRRRVITGPDLEAIETLLPLEESAVALKGLTKQVEEE